LSKRIISPADGVLVQTSELWNTNSVVITGPTGDSMATVVVDPGWYPDEIGELQAVVAACAPDRATHVLFTHGDFDHVVGWEDFPCARLIAHPEAARRDAAEIEGQVAGLDGRRGTIRPRPYRYPAKERFSAPDNVAAEVARDKPSGLNVGRETILFFPAPGHTGDGLFTVLPERGVLIAGDYLSDEEFPFIYHSVSDYKSTLLLAREICRRYGITKEVPGHGQVAMSADEIVRRISTDLDYLDRLEQAVEKAKHDGLDIGEAVKRLADFTFRGKPIALTEAHADNVRFLYGQNHREWEPK